MIFRSIKSSEESVELPLPMMPPPPPPMLRNEALRRQAQVSRRASWASRKQEPAKMTPIVLRQEPVDTPPAVAAPESRSSRASGSRVARANEEKEKKETKES